MSNLKITTKTGAPWNADASTAHKILTFIDRTPKERRDMADFYCISKPTWLGKDMYAWTFDDGSQIMMTYDENLCPVEMIEV